MLAACLPLPAPLMIGGGWMQAKAANRMCALTCHRTRTLASGLHAAPAAPSAAAAQVKGVKPYAMHATWTYGNMGGKKARLKDLGLWQARACVSISITSYSLSMVNH